MNRDLNGRFASGNNFAAKANGNKGRGQSEYTIAFQQRMQALLDTEGYAPDIALVEMSRDMTLDAATRYKALAKLADMAIEKSQHIELNQNVNPNSELTSDELNSKLKMLLNRHFGGDNNVSN